MCQNISDNFANGYQCGWKYTYMWWRIMLRTQTNKITGITIRNNRITPGNHQSSTHRRKADWNRVLCWGKLIHVTEPVHHIQIISFVIKTSCLTHLSHVYRYYLNITTFWPSSESRGIEKTFITTVRKGLMLVFREERNTQFSCKTGYKWLPRVLSVRSFYIKDNFDINEEKLARSGRW